MILNLATLSNDSSCALFCVLHVCQAESKACTCPEVRTPIRCSMADTLMVGCGCFRLRNSDVSELSINYTHRQGVFIV